MVHPVFQWLKKNVLLAVVSVTYIIAVAYVVNELIHHGQMYGISEKNSETPDQVDTATFFFVLYSMSVLGFLMMVLMAGSMINNYRLIRESRTVYLRLSDQMRAVEAAQDGIAILNREGVYTYMNRSHAQCYGYLDANDMIGKDWHMLYHPERADYFEKTVFPALNRHGRWSGQSYGLRKDGKEFPQEVTLTLLDDGGLICVVRDLTEKVETNALLRIIKLAVEAAEDGIAITDQNHKILFMNRSFLKLHGYAPYEREKFIGTDWRLMYNEAGQEQINSTVIPTTILKGSWCNCIPVMRKDGTLFFGDASLTKLPDGLILGVMRDVTERRRSEIERDELREKLFQSQKMEAIGRLTDGIAKDFEIILSNISNAAAQEKMRDVSVEIRRARDLVEQLTAFSQRKIGKSDPVDVSKLLADIREDIEAELPNAIECIVDIKIQTAYIQAGKVHMTQIVKNICQNAREAMHGQGGKIVVTLKPMDKNLFGLRQDMIVDIPPDRAQASSIRHKGVRNRNFLMTGFIVRNKEYVQMTVADSGRGIPPHILTNVFDPFFTTKAVGKGTGLGLSSVHGLMIGGGGAVIIETVEEQGTSVHLFFPRPEAFP